jgi:GBP family porin
MEGDMKIATRVVATLLAACAATAANAQSSVTLYGIISDAIGYVNNEGGKSAVLMITGGHQNNRLGFKINEDLGGGLAAIATLENGFNITNGTLGQGGRIFGRQAFVGLSSQKYGAVTFGRQYDMLWDYLDRLEPQASAMGLGDNVGSNDNIEGNFRYSNSVKYVSPKFDNVNFEALYAFSNAAGQFALNRAVSLGIGYDDGKRNFSVVYLNIDRPGLANPSGAVSDDYEGPAFQLFRTSPLNPAVGVRNQQVVAAGGQYVLGSVTLTGLFSDVRYRYLDETSLHLDNYDAAVSYQLTPALILSGAYLYTNGTYGGIDASSHWNQGQVGLDYILSKRTDVFFSTNYIRASGPLATAVLFLVSPSSSKSQIAAMGGIRHLF